MAKKVITHKKCRIDNCDGEYRPTGIIYATYPERYVHLCDKCQDKTDFFKLYPDSEIIFEENEIIEVFE